MKDPQPGQPRYNDHVPDRQRPPGYVSDIHEIVDRVFVYGTLRSGQAARSLIENHVVRAEPATIQGHIYAFPLGFPGLVDGDGVVQGEIMWLTDLAASLALLDAYEGEEFQRVLKKVHRQSGDEWAWCYILVDPSTVTLGERISDGDWIKYCATRG